MSQADQPSHKNNVLALYFSSVGHFLFHYFAAMYFTIVLALARDWQDISYENLIALWTPASILFGLLALPVGRLADRWSGAKMMIVMFVGMGLACALCGLAQGSVSLMLLMATIGIFGAIYHPVGIPWLIRNSRGRTGVKLAVNGVFGGLGSAAAGGLTGILIAGFGWRWAFILPGLFCVTVGLIMLAFLLAGRLPRTAVDQSGAGGKDGKGNLPAFMLLMAPMFVIGLVYNVTQAAMPKLFEEGMATWLAGDIVRIGFAVTLVYVIGAAMQMIGGLLADRYSWKLIYGLGWLAQVPMLLLMASFGEAALFLAAMMLVVVNTGALPAENLMLSRFAPAEHQGLAFGVKFVLAFTSAPLAIWMIKISREWFGDFSGLLIGLGLMVALMIPLILFLPNERSPRLLTEAG